MKRPVVCLALLLLAGCDRGGAGPAPGTDPPAAKPAESPAATSAAPAALASASASAPGPLPAPSAPRPGATAIWKGSYKAHPGSVTLAKEAHVKTWEKDPGTQGTGDGTITLRVSDAGAGTARPVKGEGHGALGDLLISGELDGKELHARVDPRDPNSPNAMTGVLVGALGGEGLDAVLRVSGRNGDIVREAEVKLKPE